MPRNYPTPTRAIQAVYDRTSELLMKSHPVRDSPLSIRPGMLFVTAAWLILLGILGMAPLPELPVNDKALHFFGLGFATFLIYFIIDVPESPARRVWFVRRAPLIFTLFTSFFIGGILSEFVQSLLPWKTFQANDILANLLGSSLFLYLAVLLTRRIRRRREIESLYQPMGVDAANRYGRQWEPSTGPAVEYEFGDEREGWGGDDDAMRGRTSAGTGVGVGAGTGGEGPGMWQSKGKGKARENGGRATSVWDVDDDDDEYGYGDGDDAYEDEDHGARRVGGRIGGSRDGSGGMANPIVTPTPRDIFGIGDEDEVDSPALASAQGSGPGGRSGEVEVVGAGSGR